jgi:hypothetical protein
MPVEVNISYIRNFILIWSKVNRSIDINRSVDLEAIIYCKNKYGVRILYLGVLFTFLVRINPTGLTYYIITSGDIIN